MYLLSLLTTPCSASSPLSPFTVSLTIAAEENVEVHLNNVCCGDKRLRQIEWTLTIGAKTHSWVDEHDLLIPTGSARTMMVSTPAVLAAEIRSISAAETELRHAAIKGVIEYSIEGSSGRFDTIAGPANYTPIRQTIILASDGRQLILRSDGVSSEATAEEAEQYFSGVPQISGPTPSQIQEQPGSRPPNQEPKSPK